VLAAMMICALVVVGAASFVRLGVDRFPVIDLPNVMVRTSLPAARSRRVESQMSDVLEESSTGRRHQRTALGVGAPASRCST
jgi:HAE1 family hydrophobic/amphiphilic exporter-1